jgi:tetratricopeptide (TPR) repeat protein
MDSLRKRAEQFMLKGRMDEALPLFEIALASSPDDARAWSDVGWALYDLGRHDEAVKHLKRALEIDPKRNEAWTCIGMIQTDPAEAIRCYDKALAIAPDHGGTWHLKSIALMEQGRDEEAEECFERAKSLDPAMFTPSR